MAGLQVSQRGLLIFCGDSLLRGIGRFSESAIGHPTRASGWVWFQTISNEPVWFVSVVLEVSGALIATALESRLIIGAEVYTLNHFNNPCPWRTICPPLASNHFEEVEQQHTHYIYIYIYSLKKKKKQRTMQPKFTRALIDRELRDLLQMGMFSCPHANISHYVQPASVDLPLSSTCVLVKEKVLPFQRNVRELVNSLALQTIDLSGDGGILLRGQTYMAYCGKLKMPLTHRGMLSPKSSIGRVDLMVRGVFDGSGLYDSISPNEEGELWMEISPRSFNIRARQGQALSQMMVFTSPPEGDSAIVPKHPAETDTLIYSSDGKPLTPRLHGSAIVLSLGLKPEPGTPLGWEALLTNEVVDLSSLGTTPIAPFFRPIVTTSRCVKGAKNTKLDEAITLEKDKFYILSTKERIRVPTHLSAEMIPFSHHIGELRAHYAGFFDPGFGAGRDGSLKGTVGVLEVRPHENIIIYDGQPICLIDFYLNTSVPDVAYGDAGNNYQTQRGPKLAKYFENV